MEEQVRDHLQCNVFNLSLGVAQMCQGKTPTRDFARECEHCACDAEMGVEASKVHLVAALNEDTLGNLDACVTLQGREEMACLETMPDRLHRIMYVQMLSYLKQSNLTDLAKGTLPTRRSNILGPATRWGTASSMWAS